MKKLIFLSLLLMICFCTFAQSKTTVSDSVKFTYCEVNIAQDSRTLSGWMVLVDYGEGTKEIDNDLLKKHYDDIPSIKVANYFGERGWELISVISTGGTLNGLLTYTFKKKK